MKESEVHSDGRKDAGVQRKVGRMLEGCWGTEERRKDAGGTELL